MTAVDFDIVESETIKKTRKPRTRKTKDNEGIYRIVSPFMILASAYIQSEYLPFLPTDDELRLITTSFQAILSKYVDVKNFDDDTVIHVLNLCGGIFFYAWRIRQYIREKNQETPGSDAVKSENLTDKNARTNPSTAVAGENGDATPIELAQLLRADFDGRARLGMQ